MSSVPALQLRDVSAAFGGRPGLQDISFSVNEGERCVVVGSSGVGKTTLLKAIAGLVPVTGGTIEIAGADRTGYPTERRDAVYLHQTPLLFPHLDVFENVAFPLRVRGVNDADVQDRVTRILESVQLGAMSKRRPHALSGGQRHRVALARAVVARPSVLLLDEPLSSLDPALRSDVRDVILEIVRAHNPALVMVTHDLDEAAVMADRIGVLVDGRMAQVATPADLFARPASLVIARLLGMKNEIRGYVRDGVFTSPVGSMPIANPVPNGPATAIFRPEALRGAATLRASHTSSNGLERLDCRVERLIHRPENTTAQLRIDANGAPLLLESAVDPMSVPVVGESFTVSLDSRRVAVFSDVSV